MVDAEVADFLVFEDLAVAESAPVVCEGLPALDDEWLFVDGEDVMRDEVVLEIFDEC